ncbi:hypothetical protein DWC20_05765 [Clostridium botulinum]|uniref:hypothetical protein n=1 Tax=Clostridium botulinum TaxID=1491 RepID=UPI0003682156|nr:hypothetical protein [Clostridium botulinum]MBN1035058.1 hypothetical protein [Clostridium botulinum]NFO12988.1 hypothetical protein [Clostridium botulinum]NFO29610.1 hypothetical protein [Clostridium botulinum]NFO52745.1 hypothetical protein [Clostridium botulinum]
MGLDLEKIKDFNLMLNSLCIFKEFLKDDVMNSYENLITYLNKNEFDINILLKLYNNFTYNLIEKSKEISIRKYIIDKIFNSEDVFKRLSDKSEFSNQMLIKQIKYEFNLLEKLSEIKSEDIKKCISKKVMLSEFEIDIIENLIEWNEDAKIENQPANDIYKLKEKLFNTKDWGSLSENIILVITNLN